MPALPTQVSYTEFGDLAKLRRQSKHAPNEAMQKVARQFEGLFLKMMLKSMRQASFGDSLFDSSQSELYRDMFDNQIALNMANGKGIGLADALMKQLAHYGNLKELEQLDADDKHPRQLNSVASPVSSNNKHIRIFSQKISDSTGTNRHPIDEQDKNMRVDMTTPENFVRSMWPMAQSAAVDLGVTPRVLIAQAALETGWGKSVSQHNDGRSSHNLFNIKADHRWTGDTVTKSTLEFQRGVPQRQVANFRAYASYQESFDDYVQFIKSNPRYHKALAAATVAEHYVNELQQAGYATDPHYADKIMAIYKRDSMQSPDFVRPEKVNG